ncbi:hypothetical protein LSH36_1620g00024 [Paralvinella palmiformis]|uniref:Tetraspanin n=1 Tax=Paralvinella palmiformis TaxID=53620 RepID=A0AAD9MQ97_9ANNE|nr:hypothetical protein LSH36_1620g00024 [Paralvinella palmiformis]
MIAATLLIALNLAFFLGGGSVLAVGLLTLVKPELIFKLTSLLTDQLGSTFTDLGVLNGLDLNGLIRSNGIILVVVGAVIFTLGFLGCFGAMRKSSLLLNLYAYIILGILCLEVGLAVYAYMDSDKIEAQIQDTLRLSMYKYYKIGVRIDGRSIVIPTKAEELAWDGIQFMLGCCGVSSHEDWYTADKWNRTYVLAPLSVTAKLPPSCCKRTEEGLKKGFNDISSSDFIDLESCIPLAASGSFNEVPCYQSIRNLLLDNKTIIIAVFVIVLFVEILAIGCACWLKSKIK